MNSLFSPLFPGKIVTMHDVGDLYEQSFEEENESQTVAQQRATGAQMRMDIVDKIRLSHN